MGKNVALAPKSASQKKSEAVIKAQKEAAEAKVRGFLTAKKEQYAMNILNGLLANPNFQFYNLEEGVQKLIDQAYDLADYQLNKMYKLHGEEA